MDRPKQQLVLHQGTGKLEVNSTRLPQLSVYLMAVPGPLKPQRTERAKADPAGKNGKEVEVEEEASLDRGVSLLIQVTLFGCLSQVSSLSHVGMDAKAAGAKDDGRPSCVVDSLPESPNSGGISWGMARLEPASLRITAAGSISNCR